MKSFLREYGWFLAHHKAWWIGAIVLCASALIVAVRLGVGSDMSAFVYAPF